MTTRGGVWSGGHVLRLTCPHQARRSEETLILMSFPRPAAVLDLAKNLIYPAVLSVNLIYPLHPPR
jgi:hypothetical protein